MIIDHRQLGITEEEYENYLRLLSLMVAEEADLSGYIVPPLRVRALDRQSRFSRLLKCFRRQTK